MSVMTVCVTSPQPNNDRLTQMLGERGVGVWQLPLLEYAPPSDHYATLDRAIDELSIYSIVVFASARAVSVFQERLGRHGDAPIGHLRFAVVGESTAKLCAEYGFSVHYLPREATGRALGELLHVQVPAGTCILFPQAEDGREEFVRAMQDAAARVTVVPTYRTVPAEVDVETWRGRMTTESWDVLAITSPKGLRTWLDLFGHAWCHEVMENRHLFVLGSTTAERAQHLGFRNVRVTPHATLESLSQMIVDTVSCRGSYDQ